MKLYHDNGIPRNIRCFRQKRNPSLDDICVVYTRINHLGYTGKVLYITMNAAPSSPHGICMHSEADLLEFCPRGSRIDFSELPDDCQRVVLEDYAELWQADNNAG